MPGLSDDSRSEGSRAARDSRSTPGVVDEKGRGVGLFNRGAPRPERRPQTEHDRETYQGLLTRSTSGTAGVFHGSEVIGNFAVLRWNTEHGAVGFAHSLTSANGEAESLVRDIRRVAHDRMHEWFAVVVVARARWGLHAPELAAMDLLPDSRTSRNYAPTWQQLSELFGTDVPWWDSTLRDRQAMLDWRPGVPPAVVPAQDVELPSDALTVLAADESDGSPAAQICLWLARHMRHRDTASSQQSIKLVVEERDKGCRGLTVAAVPAPLQRPAPEQPSEVVRLAGWAQITERRDTLAYAVADIAQMWGADEDWPMGAIYDLYPARSDLALEFLTRCTAASHQQPPTVLERWMLSRGVRHDQITSLHHDPQTGLPAVLQIDPDNPQQPRVLTAAPQRLPTTSRLESVSLSGEAVWIRTSDNQLWLAPQNHSYGLTWGYSGSGPLNLAILLDRLLDDITAPAVNDRPNHPPKGLDWLTEETPRDQTTTFTRAELLLARNRR